MCKFRKQFKQLPPHIQASCIFKFRELKEGASLRSIRAQHLVRFKGMRRMLSIPLSGAHRLVVCISGNKPEPIWVGTHQGYDKWINK
jgi:lambda repressor-like predicted transcriptional regulator